jgi:hypothetical protein
MATSQLTTPVHLKPMGIVGAGPLTSMIWKTGDQDAGWRYRFNLFRTPARGGRVSQLFTPADVIHFVKLAHVLAAVLADDGCLSPVERGVLKRLAADLDEWWLRCAQKTPDSNGKASHSSQSSYTTQEDRHGDTADS